MRGKIRLETFSGGRKYTQFDPATGTGSAFEELDDATISGFCEKVGQEWVAVYPDPDEHTLVVQIGGKTWDLYGPDTAITYYHRYEDAETHFKIEDDDREFAITYDAWWKDVPHFETDKWAASDEPENSEADFFGYINYLSEERERKADWIAPWSENLPD